MADAKMPEKLGRYEVIRELGKGAMGVVYEGKDPNIGRRVAIKTARREVVEASGMADEMMERFLREAQAAGALNHPNIITIYDAAEEDGIAYIAMEYLEGGDLGDIIDAKRKLGMEEIAEIGACICEALSVAHSSGVVHRDIKPANILTPTGQPLKVADFGIAHVSDSNLTQDGALIGTPHYMSPEQFMGQKLDGRSDLFSVGNILYELTTGEKPFGGEALSTVMHHVIKTDPVNPTELNFNVPDPLSQVIMKALNKRPAQRYKTGAEMAAALRESIKENPNHAIIDPSKAVAMEATITGATPAPAPAVANDATVLGDVPPNADMISTLPGDRPPSQESTIPEGPGATVAGSGPPPEATAPGGPPPPAAEAMGSTVPGSAPGAEGAAVPSGSAGGPSKGLLIGGGIAAAMLVVLAAVMMSGGGEESPPSSSSNASTTTPAGGDLSEHYYSTLQFEIYQAADDETYRRWSRDNVSMDEIDDKLNLVNRPIRILVQDANGNIAKDTGSDPTPWEIGEVVTLDPRPATAALRYEVQITNPDDPSDVSKHLGDIDAAPGPGAINTVQIVIRPAPTV